MEEINVFNNESEAISNGSCNWLIDGTNQDDTYKTYIPLADSTKIDIFDKGGDDSLCFNRDDFYYVNNKVFFEIKITRNSDKSLNSSKFGNDLYFTAAIQTLFDKNETNDTYACIHDYFNQNGTGTGCIETITAENGEIDFAKLCALKEQVANWIATNTTDCSCVADVIDKHYNLINQLMAVYTDYQVFNEIEN